MRLKNGILNDTALEVICLSSREEFKEGARMFGPLGSSKAILFEFGYKTNLGFENAGVNEDIKVLLFEEIVGGVAVVQEILDLDANSGIVKHSASKYSAALEVSGYFFNKAEIEIGTLFTLL